MKSKLLSALESNVPSLEMLPDDTVYVYDDIVLLQQLDAIHLDTFGGYFQPFIQEGEQRSGKKHLLRYRSVPA